MITPDKADLSRYFMLYQERWIRDKSQRKLAQKGRQEGFTWTEAHDDVLDAAVSDGSGMNVHFSGYNEGSAKAYIQDCLEWSQVYQLGARDMGEEIFDRDTGATARSIEFTSGFRCFGMTSAPNAYRGKRGKSVLDELAFHKDPEAMYAAAMPATTWGFPLVIMSTHNGVDNLFYRLANDLEKPFSRHKVTLVDAVNDGLADKIAQRHLTVAERQKFIDDIKALCESDEMFMQEYMCVAQGGSEAWITWEMITRMQDDAAGRPENYSGGPCYVGMDIARRRDLSVIWVNERVAASRWTREIVRMQNASFADQEAELDRVVDEYSPRRICMDQTGMGEQMVERAKKRFGERMIGGVLMTAKAKLDLATAVKRAAQDATLRIPNDQPLAKALRAVKQIPTASDTPRFDATRSAHGHADEFWAAALALHAEDGQREPARIRHIGRAPSAAALENYGVIYYG